MSATITKEPQPTMRNYNQPSYPPLVNEGRPRVSSTASKYTPDGYPIPPSTENTSSMVYFAPETPPGQSPRPYTPPNPDQYRPSPAVLSGAVPPAQLPVYYQDNRPLASDGYDRPRRASATSHHSDRSRRSSHSHSHRHRHSGHHEREHKKRHSEEDLVDKKLARIKTPARSYGGSLFALFNNVRDALRK